MAKKIVNPEIVEFDGVNLASHVQAINLNMPYDDHDSTGMGGKSHEHTHGLRDDSITVTLFQDTDAGSVDATLGPVHANKDAIDIVVKEFDATTSSSNPEYTFNAKTFGYEPVSGSAGELSTTEMTWQDATGAGIVRDPAF